MYYILGKRLDKHHRSNHNVSLIALLETMLPKDNIRPQNKKLQYYSPSLLFMR
jgi:hypothetical protein